MEENRDGHENMHFFKRVEKGTGERPCFYAFLDETSCANFINEKDVSNFK